MSPSGRQEVSAREHWFSRFHGLLAVLGRSMFAWLLWEYLWRDEWPNDLNQRLQLPAYMIAHYWISPFLVASGRCLRSRNSGNAIDGPTRMLDNGNHRRCILNRRPSAQMSAMVVSPEMRTSAQANAAMLLDVACCSRSGTLRPLADSHGTIWARGRAVPAMQRIR